MSRIDNQHVSLTSPLPLRTKLLTLLPGAKWLPNDLAVPDTESESSRLFSRRRIALHRGDTDKKKKEAKRNNAPPYHRKHNLSGIKLPGDDGEILTHAQAQSLFFAKLPRELRDMVYSFVIGDAPVVHLTLGAKKQRFAHFLCCEEQGSRQCGCSVFNLSGKRGGRLDGGILGLMRGCRRFYLETTPHLYTTPTFSLLHPSHLLHLGTALPPPRLHTIRTLSLRWPLRALPYLTHAHQPNRYAYPEDTVLWQRGWRVLASMQGLRDLFVLISESGREGGLWEMQWCGLEERLVGDVKGVRQVRRGVVVLPYRRCRTDWDLGVGCAVVLRRPGEGIEQT